AAAFLVCLLGVVIASASPPPRPRVGMPVAPQSSPVALNSAGTLLINANADSNSVTLFDATTDNLQLVAEVPVGRDPRSVAISPSGGAAYVANAGSNSVSIIDLAGHRGPSLLVGAEPTALALSPNGTRLYVANSASNNLMV